MGKQRGRDVVALAWREERGEDVERLRAERVPRQWSHAMMQEFVNEAQQHLTAGRTAAAAQMFDRNDVRAERVLHPSTELDNHHNVIACPYWNPKAELVRAERVPTP